MKSNRYSHWKITCWCNIHGDYLNGTKNVLNSETLQFLAQMSASYRVLRNDVRNLLHGACYSQEIKCEYEYTVGFRWAQRRRKFTQVTVSLWFSVRFSFLWMIVFCELVIYPKIWMIWQWWVHSLKNDQEGGVRYWRMITWPVHRAALEQNQERTDGAKWPTKNHGYWMKMVI